MSGLRFPKPRPRLLDKRQKASDLAAVDRRENAKVRARSGGKCEVREDSRASWYWIGCLRSAVHVHHLIGGSGRRNVGKSILAEHKLHVCARDHSDITGHVLVPCVSQAEAERAATVRYRRIT